MQKINPLLKSTIHEYLIWLKQDALPCWTTAGLDPEGAAYERLQENGQPDLTSDRRVRVQARQMFVFSVAHKNQWINNGLGLVEKLEEYVLKYAKTDNSAIFAHILDKNNLVLNESHDLYDVAFFLLAYAWRYHVFNDLNALHYANTLLEQINLDLKGVAGGWQEGSYPHQHRRQNPHMHLFEAFLTLYSVTKNGKWLAKAGEIFCLFETRFFNGDDDLLREFFNHDWSLAAGEKGDIIEPGHMFEWVWLLRQYHLLTGTPVDNYCFRLYHKAKQLGLDASSQLIFDITTPTGPVNNPTKRCWPMTEWIKAALVQATYASDNREYDYQQDALTALRSLQHYYLKSDVVGCYKDQIGANNKVISQYSPASTLYHLMLTGLEMQRFIESRKNIF